MPRGNQHWTGVSAPIPERFERLMISGYISDALITASGKYFVTAEEGRVQIWNTATRVVLYRDEQDDVAQLELLDDESDLFVALSCEEGKDGGRLYKSLCRNLVDGKKTHNKPIQCSIRFASRLRAFWHSSFMK